MFQSVTSHVQVLMIRMFADEIRFTSALCKCCNILNILIIFSINEIVCHVSA
jgi:hypothetical protein